MVRKLIIQILVSLLCYFEQLAIAQSFLPTCKRNYETSRKLFTSLLTDITEFSLNQTPITSCDE